MALPPPTSDSAVVVTGASSGIGRALARELAGRGHGLVLVARRRERLEALAAELDHVRVDVRPADLTDPEARGRLVEDLLAADRRIAGLCNNAGVAAGGRFTTNRLEREQRLVRLNMEAVHHLAHAFLPGMIERGGGAILNVASIAAAQPVPGLATYAATKAFVASLSEAIHAELSGTGVSVTALCPGPTRTALWGKADLEEAPRRGRPFFMDVGPVARDAVDAMERGARTATPGAQNRLASLGGRYLPRTVLLPVVAIVNRPHS